MTSRHIRWEASVITDYKKHPEYAPYWTAVHEVVASLGDVVRSGEPGSEREALGLAQGAIDWLNAELARYVRSARLSGVSWQQVGDELGVTRQAASQRFGGFERLEGDGEHCACSAHLPNDNDRCVGDHRVVRVLNSQASPTPEEWRSGIYGCELHAARLLATLPEPRVRAIGLSLEETAQRVYHEAMQLRSAAKSTKAAA